MKLRGFEMPAGLYDRLREYAHRSGERTLVDAVASLLDAAAGTALVACASVAEGSATAAASGPGAGKRRRTDPPPSASSQQETETSTAGSGEPEAEPALIDQLPDSILSGILERLGLQAAAAARAVCRRWRDAVEAIRWCRLDVKLQPERADELAGLLLGGQGLDWSRLDDAEHARAEVTRWLATRCHEDDSRMGGRRIRVAPGASLRLEITPTTEDGYGEAWWYTLSLLTAFSAAAGAASGSGGGGLGEVDVDCSCAPYCCLADLLDALAPPGAAVGPSLRSLALRGGESCDPDCSFFYLGVDPVLRPLLFPNLESLSCRALCCFPGRPDAEALARCFPRLRRLEVRYKGDPDEEIGEAMAVFPSLEYLQAMNGSVQWLESPDSLIEALASGPAALSLKELVLDWSTISRLPDLALPTLRALDRFPALQRLQATPSFELCSSVGEADLAALGSIRALKSLGPLSLNNYQQGLSARLNGLAVAFERSSSLTDLQLLIDTAPPQEALPALARLTSAARGRLSLQIDVGYKVARYAEVAAALVGAPPRSLALRVVLFDEDVEGNQSRLEGLSAFAGCSTGDVAVHLNVRNVSMPIWRLEGRWGAVREAVARALPTARLVRQHCKLI
eukprot:tig00020927_g15958.t1